MILDEFEGLTVTQEPYHRNRTNCAHVHADLQYAPNRPAITIIQKQTDGLSETQAGQQVVGRQMQKLCEREGQPMFDFHTVKRTEKQADEKLFSSSNTQTDRHSSRLSIPIRVILGL